LTFNEQKFQERIEKRNQRFRDSKVTIEQLLDGKITDTDIEKKRK
jgi:hypothetical protein